MSALLEVRGLTKRFGGLVAVEDVDIDLNAGEILAIIGPNGAGKTTTFNLIAGALAPNAGRIASPAIASPGCRRTRSRPRHHAHLPAQHAVRQHDGARERAGRQHTA